MRISDRCVPCIVFTLSRSYRIGYSARRHTQAVGAATSDRRACTSPCSCTLSSLPRSSSITPLILTEYDWVFPRNNSIYHTKSETMEVGTLHRFLYSSEVCLYLHSSCRITNILELPSQDLEHDRHVKLDFPTDSCRQCKFGCCAV